MKSLERLVLPVPKTILALAMTSQILAFTNGCNEAGQGYSHFRHVKLLGDAKQVPFLRGKESGTLPPEVLQLRCNKYMDRGRETDNVSHHYPFSRSEKEGWKSSLMSIFGSEYCQSY